MDRHNFIKSENSRRLTLHGIILDHWGRGIGGKCSPSESHIANSQV
jgi:hypothetical protein